MCGIDGGVNTEYDKGEILKFRGPDDFSSWRQDNIWMNHYRLSIIDLTEAGRQPMQGKRYVMAYNGECYSYKEMAYQLCPHDDFSDYTFPGDSRVVLNYFEKFGIRKTLDAFNGMFSIALYDKIENKLHLMVDRFAQKPLYYFNEGDVFAFASSPSALLHLRDKWKINEQALQSYWKLGSVMVDSIWDGIKKVDGSEIVTYDIHKKTITKERYWEPKFQDNTNGIQDLILDSIKKVKVADVGVYIFLSGGIDSTLVASQFSGGHAIHLDGPEYQYAKQAADRFGITLHNVSPKTTDAVEAMTDYVSKCGEPSMSALIPYIVSQEAAKLCKVAVSANGADEIMFGYDRTENFISTNQIKHIFRSDLSYGKEGLNEVHGWNWSGFDNRLSKGRWLELQTYVKHDLNKTLDFASMAHSLEVRNPFLDHRLVEMALSMTKEQIGRKEILKKMLRGYGFDPSFLNRPKMGFTLYQKPANHNVDEAFKWCVQKGWLPNKHFGARDLQYLKASAFSFKIWHETFKNKIA